MARFKVYLARMMGGTNLYEFVLVKDVTASRMIGNAQHWHLVRGEDDLKKAAHWVSAKRQGNLHLAIKRGHKRGPGRH